MAKHLREVFPRYVPVLRLDDPQAHRRRQQVVNVADPRNPGDRVGNRAVRDGEGVLDELSCANLGLLALLETPQASPLKLAEDDPERGGRNQNGTPESDRHPHSVEPNAHRLMEQIAEPQAHEDSSPSRNEQQHFVSLAADECAREPSHPISPR